MLFCAGGRLIIMRDFEDVSETCPFFFFWHFFLFKETLNPTRTFLNPKGETRGSFFKLVVKKIETRHAKRRR